MSAVPLAGLVLAGGQSRRMGRDKAALLFAGESLLERAVKLLASQLADVRVGVRPEQSHDAIRARYPLIEDRFADIGPAAGILSAHLSNPDCGWLVIACDMPLLDADTIAALIAARDIQADATAWASVADGTPEPLCAIYEPGTLAAFLESVRAGGNPSPRSWLQSVRLSLLDASDPAALKSANTYGELEKMQDHIRSQSGGPTQDET
jgi:molybdopterin-guanine dinucleotide biosynthesis protein A